MASLDGRNLDSASNNALQLQDFLGEWRDSMGHQVRVMWAWPGNRAGELDVQLLRPHSTRRDHIRLNVKALGQGQFQCGHFELKVDNSSVDKIVWGDVRVKGKVSVWEREAPGSRTRSRSRTRSPIQHQQKCGCVLKGKVALRCIDHLPLLPPRSVLHDISTPGAWAPPAKASEIAEKLSEEDQLFENAPPVLAPEVTEKQSEGLSDHAPPANGPDVAEKLSEVDRLFEAYDQSLAHAATAVEMPQPQASPDDAFHEAKAKLLVKHRQTPADHETEVPQTSSDALQKAKTQLLVKHLLVPVMLTNPEMQQSTTAPKDIPQDPRVRRGKVAPTGGA